MLMLYETIQNKALLRVEASSTREAYFKFKKTFGFRPDYLEAKFRFKDSKKHLIDAFRHELELHIKGSL